MSVNLHKISKWYHMLAGNSVFHVNQGEGKIFSKDELKGYYNDLTEKVIRFGYADDRVPQTTVDTGDTIYFSIAIFQYGLASYDLYLLSDKEDKSMLSKAMSCGKWALDNQQDDGAWVTFAYENPEYPYSAMAQGEAISLLLRLHKETHDSVYLESAKKAKEFMLLSFEAGGPTKYEGKDVYFYEYPKAALVLNGWIFALWGLMDYCKVEEDETARQILDRTITTLEKSLPKFNLSYWSKYEDGCRICSPFYHRLHVAQLKVMYELTGKKVYRDYAVRWENYANNWLYCKMAYIKKTWQKLIER